MSDKTPDNLSENINSLIFKSGVRYVSLDGKVIVKCLKDTKCGEKVYKGVVVFSNERAIKVCHYSRYWNVDDFKLYVEKY